jgi:hypothetical protein
MSVSILSAWRGVRAVLGCHRDGVDELQQVGDGDVGIRGSFPLSADQQRLPRGKDHRVCGGPQLGVVRTLYQ